MESSPDVNKKTTTSDVIDSSAAQTSAAPLSPTSGSDSDSDVVDTQNAPKIRAKILKENLNLPAAKGAPSLAASARGSAAQTVSKTKISKLLATLPTLPEELRASNVQATVCDEFFGLSPYDSTVKPSGLSDHSASSSTKSISGTTSHQSPARQPSPSGLRTAEKHEHNQSEDEAPHSSWTSPTPRLKPIIITEKCPISTITQAVKDTVGHSDFSIKSTSQGCEVHFRDSASRKKLTEFLRAFQISTSPYKPKDEDGCKVFIRYLNKNTPPEWIRKELTSLGYAVKSVSAVTNRATGEAYHGFAVHLDALTNLKEVCNVGKLGNQKVIIEPQRSPLLQCQRCQKFGHSKSQCSSPFVCVKCAGKHPTFECKKSPSEEPKCANCLGAHTASYRGCSEYLAALSHYKKTAQISPSAKAQASASTDQDIDDEASHEGASSSSARTPSDANGTSIQKLTETIQTLQSNLLEIKYSISARQCSEQNCANCCPSLLLSKRRPSCTALTSSNHLSTLSSTGEYRYWKQLGRLANEIHDTIDEIKRAERSSKLAFPMPVTDYHDQLQLLVRDFMPLLVKLNIICDRDCSDNNY
jgi:hypothetical protein